LLKVSTIWITQPIDEAVQAEWTECLSPVSFEAALEVVRELRDSGRRQVPTPGEIYRGAIEKEKRRFEDRRSRQRKLVVVQSVEERERVQAKLRGLIESIGVKKVAG
jgi:hypothetical protein